MGFQITLEPVYVAWLYVPGAVEAKRAVLFTAEYE
jgi:hypothetical protein